MLSKRIIAVVTISDGWVVQSFGYKKLLPIGRPEVVAKNLDRWGADEIVLQFIDRSMNEQGPDLHHLDLIAELGLSTPLIYLGGISNGKHALEVISRGADRIGIDSMMFEKPSQITKISEQVGSEALIACMPLSIEKNEVSWFNYKSQTSTKLHEKQFEFLNRKNFSEILIIDWKNEGFPDSFDFRLVNKFPDLGMGLIAFGGISSSDQIRELLADSRVVGVAIGNSLNYRESSVNRFKSELEGSPVRVLRTQEKDFHFENL